MQSTSAHLREHLGQPLSNGAGVGDSPARGTEEGCPHRGSTMGKGMKNMTLRESRVSSLQLQAQSLPGETTREGKGETEVIDFHTKTCP